MEIEIFKELTFNLFIQKAMFDDYCQTIAKIENLPIEQVRKRIMASAHKHAEDFKSTSVDFMTTMQEHMKNLQERG